LRRGEPAARRQRSTRGHRGYVPYRPAVESMPMSDVVTKLRNYPRSG
jgi:hypothetical protein